MDVVEGLLVIYVPNVATIVVNRHPTNILPQYKQVALALYCREICQVKFCLNILLHPTTCQVLFNEQCDTDDFVLNAQTPAVYGAEHNAALLREGDGGRAVLR
jgi:hypothetical protein